MVIDNLWMFVTEVKSPGPGFSSTPDSGSLTDTPVDNREREDRERESKETVALESKAEVQLSKQERTDI